MIRVYLAGRSEDAGILRDIRDAIAAHGIACTSSWLNVMDEDPRVGALTDLADIGRADVFVLYNPKSVHRSGTGGRHFETGHAWTIRKPILLIGEPEHVFHVGLEAATVPADALATDLVAAIWDARAAA